MQPIFLVGMCLQGLERAISNLEAAEVDLHCAEKKLQDMVGASLLHGICFSIADLRISNHVCNKWFSDGCSGGYRI